MIIPAPLKTLIMVKAPYDVIYDICANTDHSISGKVKNEYLYEQEGGPIGVSEAGRHLAILGSMVLAKDYNFVAAHYYLAIHAELKRHSTQISHSSSYLTLNVKTLLKEKRTATVSGEIRLPNNELIYTITVVYKVLSQGVFSKLFSQHKNSQKIQNIISPYINRKKLTSLVIENHRISGTYGVVLAKECEGHFLDYPALPVAIIGYLYIELGMKLFSKHTNNQFDKILVMNTTINALRLAFSGEKVTFELNIKEVVSPNSIILAGITKVKEEIISNTEIELLGVKSLIYTEITQ